MFPKTLLVRFAQDVARPLNQKSNANALCLFLWSLLLWLQSPRSVFYGLPPIAPNLKKWITPAFDWKSHQQKWSQNFSRKQTKLNTPNGILKLPCLRIFNNSTIPQQHFGSSHNIYRPWLDTHLEPTAPNASAGQLPLGDFPEDSGVPFPLLSHHHLGVRNPCEDAKIGLAMNVCWCQTQFQLTNSQRPPLVRNYSVEFSDLTNGCLGNLMRFPDRVDCQSWPLITKQQFLVAKVLEQQKHVHNVSI